MSATLLEEYRNGILETIHKGIVCIIDKDRSIKHIGDHNTLMFYRSCSKPIQILPFILNGLHEKYDIKPEEIAIMCSSHHGNPEHVEVLESLAKRLGLNEDMFVMKPTYPINLNSKTAVIKNGLPPRKVYHNCFGKHIGLILLARHYGIKEENYWHGDNKIVYAIKELISYLAEVNADDIKTGTDGCGVPVFAVPMEKIALSYLKYARPELINDESVRKATQIVWDSIHEKPSMICGEGEAVSELSASPNILAKDGAGGLITMGLRKEGLGIVIRLQDGAHHRLPQIAYSVLEKISYEDKELINRLKNLSPMAVYNENDDIVGDIKAPFTLK